MDLNFKIQRNEEMQLEKMFNKLRKKQNRKHIVEEMIEVRKAKKAAISERQKYHNYQKIPAKRSRISRWYEESGLKKKADKFFHRAKRRVYAYESVYLYAWYTVLDFFDHVRAKKKLYMSFATLCVLLVGGIIAYHTMFGYEVTYNGHTLGTVENMKTLNAAMDNVDANFKEWYANDNIYYEQSITVRSTFIKNRDDVLDIRACEEAIYACDLPLFVNGGVITVDGIETVRLASKEDAQEAVDRLIGTYVGEDTETVQVKESEVEQDIQVEEKIIEMGTEKTVSEAVSYMQNLSSEGENTVMDDAALSANTLNAENFSNALRTSSGNEGLITALNFRQDDFSVGEVTSKPALTIKTVKEVAYEEDIPFSVTYRDDPTEYMGATKDVSEGVNGKRKVTALISYVNGKEQSREILTQETITEPVNKVVARGTKALPPAESSGRFLLPVTGRVTEIWGSSSHSGGCAVDIANRTGTPIYASDSGVVTKASYYGTYGNCVIIDHGNGYKTLYAHMSKFNTSVGKQVSQGQVIGYVGNTGMSTGSHLHFEIRYNNVRQQITRYFSYLAVGASVRALQ